MAAVGAAEHPPVVEAVALPLPELDLEDADAEAAPMLGPGHVSAFELAHGGIVFGLHPIPVGHRLGLLGHARRDLGAAGADREVGVRFLRGGHLGESPDPDLTFHVLPGEVHGHPGIGAQLPALRGIVVGEEHQSTFVDAFEQDDAGGRAPFVEGGHGHRIGFAHALGGVVVPLTEQGQRRGFGTLEGGRLIGLPGLGQAIDWLTHTFTLCRTLYAAGLTRGDTGHRRDVLP